MKWVAFILAFAAGPAFAQAPVSPEVQKQLDEMRAVIEAQQQLIGELQGRVATLESAPAPAAPATMEQGDAHTADVAQAEEDPKALSVSWDDGLRFKSEDGAFDVGVGGRLQYDWAWFDQDEEYKIIGGYFPELGIDDEDDAGELRRARLSVGGKIYEYYSFMTEIEFAVDSPGGDGAQIRDVFLQANKLPYIGSLRMGHYKEPFSLEELQSDNDTMFMERSLPNAFAPSRNLGLMAANSHFNDRMTWAAGVFKNMDDWPSENDSDEDQGYQLTARVTGLPWYAKEGKRVLHLGLSASHRNPDGSIRFAARPESHLAFTYADTGRFRADDLNLLSGEAALIVGPWLMQGEYMTADVDSPLGDANFDGYYLLSSYVLTGEGRAYKKSGGVIDAVTPRRNFSLHGERGWGAWEVAARYSALDLNDGAIGGGELKNWTLGLNWYLNPNIRLTLNYVRSDVDHDLYDGDVNILQSRFQVRF